MEPFSTHPDVTRRVVSRIRDDSESSDLLERAVRATLSTDRRPTEDEVRERMEQMRRAIPVSDEEFDGVRRRLHAKLAISMDMGIRASSPRIMCHGLRSVGPISSRTSGTDTG